MPKTESSGKHSRNKRSPSGRSARHLCVLFTCIGRRVSLLRSFRQAARQLKVSASFLGTDITELSPALQLCDKRFLVKPISHPRYVSDLLRIVKAERVDLIVPTIDTDLLILAKNKAKFERLGCRVLVSHHEVIEICQDKRKTSRFLSRKGFEGPATMSVRTAMKKKDLVWPVIAKPWDGAAAKGVTVVDKRQDLRVIGGRIPNCIVQELVHGTEYTCDVFVDFNMNVRCVVPRKRIEVRAGEVSKGQVVRDDRLMSGAADVIGALNAGPGVITLQCFLQADGAIKFTEINARFGGGAPLAIKAGANFPKWILQELADQKPRIRFDGFRDGLTMLRYDAEVWLQIPP